MSLSKAVTSSARAKRSVQFVALLCGSPILGANVLSQPKPYLLCRICYAVGSGLALTLASPPRSTPPAADAGCSTKELEAFASSTRDISVGSSLFSVELRPEPTAEKKTVSDRLIPSPSPRPLPKGEGEPLGSSGRAECAKAFGRAGDGRVAAAPSFGAWDRSRHSRTLTKRSHVLPLPGNIFVRSRIGFEGTYFWPYLLISHRLAASSPKFRHRSL